MTRLYGRVGSDAGRAGRAGAVTNDVAEVLRRDDSPEQFLWRDRLYLVRDVLDHWIESGGWWRASRSATAPTELTDSVNDGEREFWRVEAGAGRLGDTGVFDLCFDWSPGQWTIVRVQD